MKRVIVPALALGVLVLGLPITAQAVEEPRGDLAVQLAGPATAPVGSRVTYKITVVNNGPSPTTQASLTLRPRGMADLTTSSGCRVFFFDYYRESGAYGCTVPGLPVGATKTFTISGKASMREAPYESSMYAAVFWGQQPNDPVPGNDTATAQTAVFGAARADLALAVTGPARAKPGQRLRYRATVRNRGPIRADKTWVYVSIEHPEGLPAVVPRGCSTGSGRDNASLVCPLNGIPRGAARSFDFTVNLPAQIPAISPGRFLLEARASSLFVDPRTADNHTKKAVVFGADMKAAISGPHKVALGDIATYRLTVSNNGPVDATGVNAKWRLPGQLTGAPVPGCQITDDVARCPVGRLNAGRTRVFAISGRIGPREGSDIFLYGRAYAAAPADHDPSNNEIGFVGQVIAPQADVRVTGAAAGPFRRGGTGLYQLTLVNHGPTEARNVVVAGALPRGLRLTRVRGCKRAGNAIRCRIARLAPGARLQIAVVVKVARTAPSPAIYRVAARSVTPDPAPRNNLVIIRTALRR